MNRTALAAGILFPVLALAGCQSIYAPEPMRPTVPQQSSSRGIEGDWVDPNGIVSSFSGGSFETRTTDTNSVLATGSYSYTTNNEVAINLHSRLRNTDSTVNCALVNPTQLNCTSSTGSQFSLVRMNMPMTPAG